MFTLKQTANNRWQVTAGYDAWKVIPAAMATKILWRSFASAQEAFSFAAECHFEMCDRGGPVT